MLGARCGTLGLCVVLAMLAMPSISDISGGISAASSSSNRSPLSRWIFRFRHRHHESAAMMIKSHIPIPTATPTIVWSLRTGPGIAEVRASVPSAAFAAEAEALGVAVVVVVLRAMVLVTTDAPAPAAELNSVEIGIEAELNSVDTALSAGKPRSVEELPGPDDAVTDAPDSTLKEGRLSRSIDDDPPTGG